MNSGIETYDMHILGCNSSPVGHRFRRRSLYHSFYGFNFEVHLAVDEAVRIRVRNAEA